MKARGYLRIDHRPSGGQLEEHDTVHCVHCQALIVRVGTEYRGIFCGPCSGPRCPTPACTPCVPFLRKLELRQRRDRFAVAAALITR